MAIYVQDENESSTITNLPIGFYYYLIPRDKISSASYLGWVDTIQSITFNPFIEEEDLTRIIDCPFNTEKYGRPNSGVPKCYRIESDNTIVKYLEPVNLFKNKQEVNFYDPKLQMFPFRYFIITDYINSPLLIKPQYVNTNDNTIKTKVTTTPLSMEAKYNISVEDYKGDFYGNLEGINSNTSLMLPVTSSIYSQFISTSMSSFAQGNINAMLENDKTLNQGLASNSLQYNINKAKNNVSLIGGGFNILGNLLGGNIGGALQSGFSSGMNYALNNQINNMQSQLIQNQLNENAQLTEYEINTMTQAKITDMLNTPNSIKTSGNDTIFNLTNSRKKIEILEYKPKDNVIERINIYFKKYGYRFNKYDKLGEHINSRKYFNFVKTNNCNIATAKVPLIHLEEVKEIFNRGTTIWHIDNGAEPLDYNVDNMEV